MNLSPARVSAPVDTRTSFAGLRPGVSSHELMIVCDCQSQIVTDASQLDPSFSFTYGMLGKYE